MLDSVGTDAGARNSPRTLWTRQGTPETPGLSVSQNLLPLP